MQERRKLGYLQTPTKWGDLLLAIQNSKWAEFYLRPWTVISLDSDKVSLGSLERVLQEGAELPQAAPTRAIALLKGQTLQKNV